MRKLNKTVSPQVLTDNWEKWTRELLAKLESGESPTDYQRSMYRHQDIKGALIAETFAKCAYCESKFQHVTYGDIEHVIPKSKVPRKAFKWENLTIACDVCNTKKGDFLLEHDDSDHEALFDPYADDPKDHFMFHREVITPLPDSEKGYVLCKKLELTRGALLERRRERLNFIDGLIKAYCLSKNADEKAAIREDIFENHATVDKEYYAFMEEYLNDLSSKGII